MITVGIPAFNEEENIETTVNTILSAVNLANNIKVEIIIVNDGSTDKTGEISDRIASANNKIRVIHNKVNSGLGIFIQTIIREAKYDKFCLIAGDGNVTLSTIKNYFLNSMKADLVMVYILNTEDRLQSRSVLSSLYSLLYCIFFKVHVKYINGAVVYPTKLLREMDIKGKRYSFASEVAVKLLRQGASFYEMGGYIKPNVHKSSAMKIRNLIDVVLSFLYLIYEVNIKFKEKYSHKPVRMSDET
jgi:glycosyltransferase involved in cell wall biosynthesis